VHASPEFNIPLWFDLLATGLFALTGAAVAIRRGFDYVGIFALAFVTGIGGGVLRDSVFLQLGTPAALRDWHYTATVAVASIVAIAFARRLPRISLDNTAFAFVDAVALGMYAAIGVQKSLDVHLEWLAAVIVGVLNAVGGGVIRDVLAQRPAMLFQPSQLYGVAALAGCLVFVAIDSFTPLQQNVAGICAVIVTVTVRMLAVRFDWRTRAVTFDET
jgi:uncharacterized membrane protein YeiH